MNSKNLTYFLSYSYLVSILLFCNSCQSDQSDQINNIAFYHWKSNADYSDKIESTLTETTSNKIYMHYFDVDVVNTPTYYDSGIYPTYTIKSIDEAYKKHNIVPVVYITNQVFKSENLRIKDLAKQVKDLIHQISQKHFKKELKQIQIDCDWTQSTKNVYFEFLNLLQKDFDIDVTIRLHQIKFKDKTGVPPVKHGTLMLYNMGDLKNNQENSILESSIVEQYVNSSSDYPINLHLGLPIFSQTILTNNDNEYKIIKHTDRQLYVNDNHFKQLDHTNFAVNADTLYKGFYLSPGFNLKLEEIDENEIIKSYQIIKNSQLNIDEIIFYHLDDQSLNTINVNALIKKL